MTLYTFGVVIMAVWLMVALKAFVVDAYPTTSLRPAVPYQALSIANGLHLYQEHCAVCHGVTGRGDGPAAAGLWPYPADLTAKHTADHTAGDLFWWLTHGIARSAMPGFQDRLDQEERWDLINFLRALPAAAQARSLLSVVDPNPWLVAPDFSYSIGVGEERTLKDHRGRGLVLLVLFSLPGSVHRLAQLHGLYPQLRAMRMEVLGIPLQNDRQGFQELSKLSVGFPIVMDRASEAANTYSLFRKSLSSDGLLPDPPIPTHLEFLIDHQGYIRARWLPSDGQAWAASEALVATIQRLKQEKPCAPAPDEHVH